MTWIDVLSERRVVRRGFASSLAIASVLVMSMQARAEGGADAAAARALFAQGRTLMGQGKYADACPKFQESYRLKPGIGTRFNLADCWEKLGRTASAWGEFLEVANLAKSQGQRDRENVARERAKALEAKLSYLTIQTEETDPELRVTRDGIEVGRGSFDTPVPVDPGTHTIEASAPKKETWSTTETVESGKRAQVSIPKLTPAQTETPVAASEPTLALTTGPANASGAAAGGPPPDSADGGGLGVQRALGLGLGGLGVAGLAAGTVFFLGYNSKNDEAKSVCPTGVCEESEIERHKGLIDDAKQQRTLSYVGFAAGGALLVAGAIVFFTAPSSASAETAGVQLVPLVGPTQGVAVTGSF